MRTRIVGTAAAAALLTLATACGGIATQDQGGQSLDCGDTVNIGAPYPLSGVWAENGQNSLNGMQLAADEINAAGGIKGLDGARIKVVSGDTSSDNPGQAKTVTENLLQSDDVSAVVGSYLSSMTLTTVVATETKRVPLITQSFVDDLTAKGYTYLFQIPPKASAFGSETVTDAKGVYAAQNRPLRTLAVAGSDDASTKAQTAGVVAGAGKEGVQVAEQVTFPNGLSDATAIVNRVSDANADLIVLGGNVSDLSLIIKGIRARGVTTPIATSGGGGALAPQFAKALGDSANGIMASAAWNGDVTLTGVADAAKEYQQKYNAFMPQEAGESWAAIYELAQVMDEGKTCDPQKIRDALAGTDFTTGQAAAVPPGKVGFDATGANKYIKPILVQWQNGTLKTVFPKDVASTDALPLGAGPTA
ncbi:branched-chain amino acid ABC transporter substrate-binding protein [Pseudonocardia sulfidoxydans NBRC 16205]|uniref:Branched-chain amino acid ABC transporter substrate-binding protein n=1 Tax=Pseudonocardia sulfidoxydans NBRC 16205 TaxID=1223511 RepID=A0A511DG54_9PSEU|nr:ABC transporter substrate-binding protein [Pseudonocardia sulfidoxydans]GEL21978.1 branched-chain amino acid ABC transporter substrate-binding protein [Pseudonocardia sulfidoxydans NBRC 16205]